MPQGGTEGGGEKGEPHAKSQKKRERHKAKPSPSCSVTDASSGPGGTRGREGRGNSSLHGGNVLRHFGELTKCNKVPGALGTVLHCPSRPAVSAPPPPPLRCPCR